MRTFTECVVPRVAVPPTMGLKPIDGMPPNHPSVVSPMCGTTFAAGDPIPKTSLSTYATYSGAGRSCKATPAAVLFYGYDYPASSSANTGYEVADTTAFYMILDEDGDVYLVLVLDKARGSKQWQRAVAVRT